MEGGTEVASQGKTSKVFVGRYADTDSLRDGNSHERKKSAHWFQPCLFLLVHFDDQCAMGY